ILSRSQTINNLIDDINELNDIDDNKINTITISDEYETALKYLELEKIENQTHFVEKTKYVKILIDRLKLYIYLDMDEEYDIKPLAKYIGEKIEKNLY